MCGELNCTECWITLGMRHIETAFFICSFNSVGNLSISELFLEPAHFIRFKLHISPLILLCVLLVMFRLSRRASRRFYACCCPLDFRASEPTYCVVLRLERWIYCFFIRNEKSRTFRTLEIRIANANTSNWCHRTICSNVSLDTHAPWFSNRWSLNHIYVESEIAFISSWKVVSSPRLKFAHWIWVFNHWCAPWIASPPNRLIRRYLHMFKD